MDSTKKLLIALAVLGALVGAVYLQRQGTHKEQAAHSLAARAAELPKLDLSEDATKGIDTIEITQPPKVDEKKESKDGDESEDDGAPPSEADTKPTKVVLVKKGDDDWELKEPVSYKANASNVTSLLNNLKQLKVTEQIAKAADSYDKWGVSDEKGLRAVFKKGQDTVFEAFFGESGSRGQMTRLADKEGVYAIKGYSKYLYARDAAGWRDKTIFKFEDKDVAKVTIENENGTFTFERTGSTWTGKVKAPKAATAKDIEDFKPSKVDDMLRAYKSLSASAFGDDKKLADVGLEEPKATVTIELKDGTGKYTLSVGDTAEGTNRWVKASGKDTIFSISSWSADWATAEESKFQDKKKDDDAKEAKKDD
jgi:hypothetical protein